MYSYNTHKKRNQICRLKKYYNKYYNLQKPRKNKLLNNGVLMDEFIRRFKLYLQGVVTNSIGTSVENMVLMNILMQAGDIYAIKKAVLKMVKESYVDTASDIIDRHFGTFCRDL